MESQPISVSRPETPAGLAERPPAHQVMARFGSDVLRMPGVQYVKYAAAQPEQITVRTHTPELAQLIDNALRDSIDGVRIVVGAVPGSAGTPAETQSWVDRPSSIAAAAAALPGIVDHQFEPRAGSYAFWVTDRQKRDHLRELVSESIGPWRTAWVMLDPAAGTTS